MPSPSLSGPFSLLPHELSELIPSTSLKFLHNLTVLFWKKPKPPHPALRAALLLALPASSLSTSPNVPAQSSATVGPEAPFLTSLAPPPFQEAALASPGDPQHPLPAGCARGLRNPTHLSLRLAHFIVGTSTQGSSSLNCELTGDKDLTVAPARGRYVGMNESVARRDSPEKWHVEQRTKKDQPWMSCALPPSLGSAPLFLVSLLSPSGALPASPLRVPWQPLQSQSVPIHYAQP